MPILECDGRLFKEALFGSLAWLTVNRDEVDALNVFPVPDGDTGTNMLLTLQSAVDDIRDLDDADLSRMAHDAYGTFRHPAVAPLTQLASGTFVLELFHGPTLAFKDLAMQFLSRLMDYALVQRGERSTIVVATSGDTGGAAVEGAGATTGPSYPEVSPSVRSDTPSTLSSSNTAAPWRSTDKVGLHNLFAGAERGHRSLGQ